MLSHIKVHFVLRAFLCIFDITRATETVEINFINDFFQSAFAPYPVTLTAFLCWRRDISLNLVKKLSSNPSVNAISILNLKARPLKAPALDQHVFFLTDSRCSGFKDFTLEADKIKLFTGRRWLILNEEMYDDFNETSVASQNNDVILKLFDDINILPDSEIIIAKRVNLHEIEMTDIYKTGTKTALIASSYGRWNNNNSILDLRKSPVLAIRRQNLMKLEMPVSVVLTVNDTINHLMDYRDTHVDTITKANYFLVRHLTDTMNATRKYTYVNTWGYRTANSSLYGGMIGELQDGIAEIGGSPLYVTKERIPIIEYIADTIPTKAMFVFRQPPLSYVRNLFTLPFSRMVWIAGGTMVILIAVILYAAVFWEVKNSKTEIQEDGRRNQLQARFSDVILVTVGAVCQQGSNVEPRGGAGRIIVVFSFIALMFLYVSYSANIVALLQSSANSIQTLNDLLNSRLKLGVDDTVYNRYFFSIATEPVRKAIYDRKIAPPGQKKQFLKMIDGVTRIRQGLYAFHMELGVGYKLINDIFEESEKCGLKAIEYLQIINPWMAIRKKSAYSEIIKIGVRKIQEVGLQNRQVSRLYTKKPECLSRGSGFISVGLIDSYPAFLVLACGAGCAIGVWFLELLSRIHTKQRAKHDWID